MEGSAVGSAVLEKIYQNMPNLHNLYKSAEKKITEELGMYGKILIAM